MDLLGVWKLKIHFFQINVYDSKFDLDWAANIYISLCLRLIKNI